MKYERMSKDYIGQRGRVTGLKVLNGKKAKKDNIRQNQDPWASILIQEETQDGLRVRIAPHPAEEGE